MSTSTSLNRPISPPPLRPKTTSSAVQITYVNQIDPISADSGPSLAAIEAGEAKIRDHLAYFATHLEAATRISQSPRLAMVNWRELYLRNQHPKGRHFVVHQHDHPVSGVHYDLRLQCNEDSSISFAIPYGLPGFANSIRPMRMAIETRVHCLWNHLIESASHATGSLLIWDTGEYEVLQSRNAAKSQPQTDDEEASLSDTAARAVPGGLLTDSEKLSQAFQRRHIRLRLHGSRLPQGYTIALRLPKSNDTSGQPVKKPRYRRRKGVQQARSAAPENETTDSDVESAPLSDVSSSKKRKLDTTPATSELDEAEDAVAASGGEEDEMIRANNAYPGAHNTIGSIHQRRWFLSLDKENSGFEKSSDTGKWRRRNDGHSSRSGWEPFFVLGREHERSVVTGRLATEVMEDENVKWYKGRKMWRPVVE